MEEQKFPIYKFSARWNQDDYQNNGTYTSRMYRTKPSPDELVDDLNKWWSSIVNNAEARQDKIAIKDKHPELLDLRIEFYEENTWCIQWFSHMTYNKFETEQEVFRSFYKFVQEKLPLHINAGESSEYLKAHPELKTYCLMGAEDSWRWKLCDCENCKKEGITAILH